MDRINNEYLLWKIKDYATCSPRQQYDLVVKDLNMIPKNVCGLRCRFNRHRIVLNGDVANIPMLIRSSRDVCSTCDNNVSSSGDNFCYKCAMWGTLEYNYHHYNCSGFTPVIIDPEEFVDDFGYLL